MTRLAQAALNMSSAPAIQPSFMMRLRSHFVRMAAARAGQARTSALSPDAVQDTGLPPEELTGAPAYDPELPFFLQASFGRGER